MKKSIDKILRITDILVCALLIIIGISKGGFYKEDIIFPVLAITGLGLIYAVIKLVLNIRENGIIKKYKLITLLDMFMVLLPISYLLPIIFKSYLSLENSMFEAIRYLNCTIVYFIVRLSKNQDLYSNLCIALAVIMGICGIDEITFRVLENIGIKYLPRNGSVVSSAVEYANIAGIIMLIGLNICLHRLCTKNETLYEYLVAFLECVILLTASRMTFFILITFLLAYMLYYKKISIGILLLTCVFVTGILTKFIENNNYVLGILTIFVLLVIIFIKQIALKNKLFVNKLNSENIKLNKKIVIYLLLAGFAVISLIATIPVDVNVKASNETQTLTKKTNSFITGENNIYVKVTPMTEDTVYSIAVNEIRDDYSTWYGKERHSSNLKENELSFTMTVPSETKFLQFVFTVYSGEIEVSEVKVNGNDITMSYLLLPDKLLSRITESFTLDLSNFLRFEYYKDAIKLWKTSPVIGLGGEAFKLGYQMVQDNSYISSEVHNSVLQIMTEAGIIGGIAYISILVLAIIISIKVIKQRRENFYLIVMLMGFILMSTFDLTLSFAIMTYLFAVIIGKIANKYMTENIQEKETYKVDNKSGIAMIKIVLMCLYIIVIFAFFVYILNVYRASLLSLPKFEENEEEQSSEYQDKLYEKIVVLEEKLKLDKFNINYMTELNITYAKYIEILKGVSLATIDEKDREYINEEFSKMVLKQKANADKMVETEFYSKYALEQVAVCYFTNYMRYAEILGTNFENLETAYGFFLNYALKLTCRIKSIGENNKVANVIYTSILNKYVEILTNQNKIIQSDEINRVILQMNNLIDKYE